MRNNEQILIEQGCQTAFINSNISSEFGYRPQLIFNNYEEGKKVLSTIESELLSCDEFFISVAFITMGGLVPLLQTLRELEAKNIHGRILTTDYLMFSQPKALDMLANYKNIELKMYCCNDLDWGFHTKGYVFRKGETYRIIVGSSNLTSDALTKNKEWNSRIVSTKNGEYTSSVLSEFETMWNSSYSIPYEEFIEEYRNQYKSDKEKAKSYYIERLKEAILQPNSMQEKFMNNVSEIIQAGESRALLISATGTGKTYASAFALRDNNPKKVLFLVHREQIAKQAQKSYKRVIGAKKSYGLLSGNYQEMDVDYLFSTMQMMSKEHIHNQFKPDEFDIIVIDEVHRAGANSYQKIMDYFTPKFWLGMTASPERTDDFDIFELFDHNIAYEIRLQEALEQDLLCPFHYYGITDLTINDEVYDDSEGLRNFSRLVSDDRVNYVIQQAKYFGYDGERVKGLIFVSRNEEAKELSEKFNARGYRTVTLSGANSQEEREECIERLVSDSRSDYLDYIFTVDIFNEGVDIPEVNQIIMLRPTQSPIVFVQQLGRGLRKSKNKEYVVILDFIANYKNNYMIPIALSGDRSYNKDAIRRYVMEGTRVIPGNSTIHFDEISRKKIFDSIDAADFKSTKLIKESYTQLKNRLGRIPTLMDFELHGSIDPLRIFENSNFGSYHSFLMKNEKEEYTVRFDTAKEKMLEFICKRFASGKRVHELLAIQYLMNETNPLFTYLSNELINEYKLPFEEKTKVNLVNVLTNQFPSGTGAGTYAECVLIETSGDDYIISNYFANLLEDKQFYEQIKEVVEFGLFRNKKDYGENYKDTSFNLYAKYTYDDVCRLLEWKKAEVAQNIGGYKYDENTNTYPVFIKYDKTDEDIPYEDQFITPSLIKAISKSGRSISSKDVQTALSSQNGNVEMHLFVCKEIDGQKEKKSKEAKEFYYLGKIKATGECYEFNMVDSGKRAVEIYYELDTPVREDIYDYIVN